MIDPFEAVNCYLKRVMETAITVPVDANKLSSGWVSNDEVFGVVAKGKTIHRCVENLSYEVRNEICRRLIEGKGLPDLYADACTTEG